jgi:rubrerythrin
MILNTCAQVVSLAKELETQSAKFYRDLSKKLPPGKETFLAFAQENDGYYAQVERAYYGVITDAFEGCFAFQMNPGEYRLDTKLPAKAAMADAVKKALAVEEKMTRFYLEAAEQSKALMADVPRAMKLVAKKRGDRPSKLKGLLKRK